LAKRERSSRKLNFSTNPTVAITPLRDMWEGMNTNLLFNVTEILQQLTLGC